MAHYFGDKYLLKCLVPQRGELSQTWKGLEKEQIPQASLLLPLSSAMLGSAFLGPGLACLRPDHTFRILFTRNDRLLLTGQGGTALLSPLGPGAVTLPPCTAFVIVYQPRIERGIASPDPLLLDVVI